eukprot:TRINITY_DN2049_c0_g1_i1.p3 TRINITY_DN2049_c0_g1~~TRINITY_DN2049_c0_g1_i1.p3  ORF type:complete len:51 (-),score=4.46 TRINITY_DN2049_c0_g1_i1:88-240(-)
MCVANRDVFPSVLCVQEKTTSCSKGVECVCVLRKRSPTYQVHSAASSCSE